MFRDTFQEELEYLRELARSIAREYPVLEPYLTAPEGDASLERVLEGTAFLSAGLRRKLDDDVPELTHPILDALAPQLMRSGPAMSILGFEPVGQMVTEPHLISAGTEVDSAEVDGTSCRFRTTWDVTLLPLNLVDARVEGDVGGTPSLVFHFEITSGAKPEDLALDRLRLYLSGEPDTRSFLYSYLSESVAAVSLRAPGQRATDARLLPQAGIHPAGFSTGEGLWPDPPGLPIAYRLIQEYFTFAEKFWFVDLVGVGKLGSLGENTEFEVAVRFDRLREPQLRASREDFRSFVPRS